jgi:hypothetical protein
VRGDLGRKGASGGTRELHSGLRAQGRRPLAGLHLWISRSRCRAV